MKSRLLTLIVPLVLVGSLGAAFAEEAKPAENLSRLEEAAVANNPEVKSSEARWRMFRTRVAQAASWEDPMLMLKLQNGIVTDPLNFSKDSMTQKVIGISQQIPYFGKTKLKEEVAAKEAESYRWLVEERKLELRRMVAETYYQIYFTDRSLDIVNRNIKILDDFITLAETKYSVGQGAQQDVFKAQVERSKMLDMQISLEQQRRTLQATLNALLYRPAETPVGRIPDFDLPSPPPAPDVLRQTAVENRPLLKSLQATVEKGEAGHKLAKKEYYPDFNVSFEYMQRDRTAMGPSDDMYSLGLTFNLPIHRERREAMAAESSSETNMALSELNATRNSIDSGIADLLAQLERRRKLVDLYKNGIIPQAEQSLESATIGYRVNKVDFLTLLDSRVTLFNYEKELYDSLADYQMKQAQLEALIGKPLR